MVRSYGDRNKIFSHRWVTIFSYPWCSAQIKFCTDSMYILSSVILPWHVISILCEVGWHEWNQACYKVSNKQMSFSDASATCKQEGAELASIHTFQENEFIRNISGSTDVFIGLSDSNIEGTFVWSDGCPLAYTNWEAGEPDNDYGLGDCVLFQGGNGKWNDTPCDMWYEYVCKSTCSPCSREQGK